MTEITGRKGGKGGGGSSAPPRTPVEAPNTLRSRATARILDVISEGQIGGLVNGAKSIYFNDTPLLNASGESNFKNVAWAQRFGLPIQSYVPGFPSVEAETTVGKDVTTTTPAIESTTAADIDAMRVTLSFDALYSQDKTTGDVNGYSASLRISHKLSSSSIWTNVLADTITGKTMTRWEKDYRIERPAGNGIWDVKVERTSLNDTDSSKKSMFSWERKTEINDVKIEYENTAYVALAIDSESTGGQVPKRSFDCYGLLVQVPVNYTPTQFDINGNVVAWSTLSGNWNGTFKTSFCDDPVWLIYDLLTDPRYGLGLDAAQIDTASFYAASVYNNGLVPAIGSGSFQNVEPRFRWNGSLSTQTDSWKLLQAIAATCRAVVYESNGVVKMLQDRPTSTTRVFNNANVIAGVFEYTGTPINTRYTAVNYSYSEPKDRYLPVTITEEAPISDINIYGFNQVSIAGQGVTSETHARRMAKWILETGLNSTDVIKFGVGWRDATIEPGEVVEVFDKTLNNSLAAGLIKSVSGTTVTLDRAVTLAAATTYKLLVQVVSATGVVTAEERTVTSAAGTRTTITINSAFTVTPLPYTPWILNGPVLGVKYKVLNITQGGKPGELDISAAQYDPTKFARIDNGGTVVSGAYRPFDSSVVERPSNLVVSEQTAVSSLGNITYSLVLNWQNIKDPLFHSYTLQWRRNEEQWQVIENIQQTEAVITPAYAGKYSFRLFAQNTQGVLSPAANLEHDFLLGVNQSPLVAVSNVRLIGAAGTQFYDPYVNITWDNNNRNNASLAAVLFDIQVEVLDTSDNVVNTYYVTDDAFYYTNDMIITDFGVNKSRALKFRISCRDTQLRLSAPEVKTFTNNAPSVPAGVTLTPFFSFIQLEHNEPIEVDKRDIRIWLSKTAGFTPDNTNLAKVDVGTLHLVEAEENTQYYLRFAVTDSYSNSELAISSEYSITTLNSDVGFNVPAVPTGLAQTTTLVTATDGTQTAVLSATWNVAADATTYDFRIDPANAGAVVYSAQTNTYAANLQTALQYTIDVRARNVNAVSAWSAPITFTSASDTTPPAVGSGLTASAGIEMIILSWTRSTASDFASYQIFRNTTNNSATATLIATQAGTVFTDNTLLAGDLRYYWIKVVDRSGNASAFSTVASATAEASPAGVIPPGSITATEIADGAITTPKIFANAVTADKIAANTITAGQIAAGTITAAQIAANTITANEIAANSITTSELAADSVTSAKIVAGTIVGSDIAADTLTAANIAAGAITANELAVGSVTANAVSTNEIIANSANIKDSVIINAKILDATIQGAKIANATISSAKIADAAITTAKIADLAVERIKIKNRSVTNNWTVSIAPNETVNILGTSYYWVVGTYFATADFPERVDLSFGAELFWSFGGSWGGTNNINGNARYYVWNVTDNVFSGGYLNPTTVTLVANQLANRNIFFAPGDQISFFPTANKTYELRAEYGASGSIQAGTTGTLRVQTVFANGVDFYK